MLENTATKGIVFDDESLIRVFVRLRFENVNNTNNKTSETHPTYVMSIHDRVVLHTGYRLPIQLKPTLEERNVLLRQVLSDMKLVQTRVSQCEKDTLNTLNVTIQVVQPVTILYFDTISRLPISYDEYERRYFEFIRSKCVASAVLPLPPTSVLFSTGSSPYLKRRRLVSGVLCGSLF